MPRDAHPYRLGYNVEADSPLAGRDRCGAWARAGWSAGWAAGCAIVASLATCLATVPVPPERSLERECAGMCSRTGVHRFYRLSGGFICECINPDGGSPWQQ